MSYIGNGASDTGGYIGQVPGLGKRTVYRYVATSGQTNFTGADASGNVLSYTPFRAYLDVLLNGVLLDSSEYTATTGNSVQLSAGAVVGSVLTIIHYGVYAPVDVYSRSEVDGFVSPLAPKASPTFTGAPTAPTPPITEDSTRIATTAWVRGARDVSGGDVNSLTASGRYFGNGIANMPNTGHFIILVENGYASGTIQHAFSYADDEYYIRRLTSSVAPWVRLARASELLAFTPVQQGGGAGQGANKVYLGWDGAALKAQVDVTDLGPLWSDSASPRSLVANGYQKLPSGLIIQWGYVNVSYAGEVITFPVAFPNACRSITAMHFGTDNSISVIVSAVSNSQCTLKGSASPGGPTYPAYYMAIGN